MRPPSSRPGRPPSGMTTKTKHTYCSKEYFRDSEVNNGFYSKKREGVADVDPKVSKSHVNANNLMNNRSWSPTFLFPAGHQEELSLIDRESYLLLLR